MQSKILWLLPKHYCHCVKVWKCAVTTETWDVLSKIKYTELSTKGAFILGSIVWSEPEFDWPPPPAPAGLRSYYFIWVRTVVRLHHQASSCLPRCLVTTARENAAKCKRLLSALLYIYVFEPFVLFTKLQYIKHLHLSCQCTANALKNAEGEQKWDIQLAARQESEWNTQTHIFIK